MKRLKKFFKRVEDPGFRWKCPFPGCCFMVRTNTHRVTDYIGQQHLEDDHN